MLASFNIFDLGLKIYAILFTPQYSEPIQEVDIAKDFAVLKDSELKFKQPQEVAITKIVISVDGSLEHS